MLEDVEVSRLLMKRMKSTGEMTEPWGTPALIECRLERVLSTLTAIHLSERKLPIQLVRVRWRPNIGSLARRPLCQTRSKGLEISREITLLGEIGWVLKMVCDFAILACVMGQVGKWLEPVGLEDGLNRLGTKVVRAG